MKKYAFLLLLPLFLSSCGSSSEITTEDISPVTGTFCLGRTDSNSLKLDSSATLTIKDDKTYTLKVDDKTYGSYFHIAKVKQAYIDEGNNAEPIKEKEGVMEINSISFSSCAENLPDPLGKSFSENAAINQCLFHYLNGHHDSVGYDCSIVRYGRSNTTNEGPHIEEGMAFYRID